MEEQSRYTVSKQREEHDEAEGAVAVDAELSPPLRYPSSSSSPLKRGHSVADEDRSGASSDKDWKEGAGTDEGNEGNGGGAHDHAAGGGGSQSRDTFMECREDPKTPPTAAAAAAAGAVNNAAPPRSPMVHGLSPASARDMRWLQNLQSGASSRPAAASNPVAAPPHVTPPLAALPPVTPPLAAPPHVTPPLAAPPLRAMSRPAAMAATMDAAPVTMIGRSPSPRPVEPGRHYSPRHLLTFNPLVVHLTCTL